jgi:hypothetical protein
MNLIFFGSKSHTIGISGLQRLSIIDLGPQTRLTQRPKPSHASEKAHIEVMTSRFPINNGNQKPDTTKRENSAAGLICTGCFTFLTSLFLISSIQSRSISFVLPCLPPQTTRNFSSLPLPLPFRKPHYTVLPSSIHAISSPDVHLPYRLNATNCRAPGHRDPVPGAV